MAIFGKKSADSLQTVPGSELKFETSDIDFRLENGKQLESYHAVLTIDSHNKTVEITNIDVSNCPGLQVSDNFTVTGIPQESGEFDITVSYYEIENSKQIENEEIKENADDTIKAKKTKRATKTSKANTNTLSTAETSKRILTKQIKIFINPDPKLMWLNIASDPADVFYKPDAETKYFTLSGIDKADKAIKQILTGRVRGRSHAHQGTCCDDDFFVNRLKNKWHILVLADGAGSALCSRKGSQLAVYETGCYLTDLFNRANTNIEIESLIGEYLNIVDQLNNATNPDLSDPNLLNSNFVKQISQLSYSNAEKEKLMKAFNALNHKIVNILQASVEKAIESHINYIESEEGKFNKINLADLYTTLNIVLSKKINDKWFVMSFSVGDGVIGLYNEDKVDILNIQDNGEFAGQTAFLTPKVLDEADFPNRCLFSFVDEFKAILCMTDGVSDPIFETENGIYELDRWQKLWDQINTEVIVAKSKETAMIDYLNFWSKGHHDDRTLAIIF